MPPWLSEEVGGSEGTVNGGRAARAAYALEPIPPTPMPPRPLIPPIGPVLGVLQLLADEGMYAPGAEKPLARVRASALWECALREDGTLIGGPRVRGPPPSMPPWRELRGVRPWLGWWMASKAGSGRLRGLGRRGGTRRLKFATTSGGECLLSVGCAVTQVRINSKAHIASYGGETYTKCSHLGRQ